MRNCDALPAISCPDKTVRGGRAVFIPDENLSCGTLIGDPFDSDPSAGQCALELSYNTAQAIDPKCASTVANGTCTKHSDIGIGDLYTG